MPLRQYIQIAFGIPGNTKGWVIGPDWINTTTYVIHGKPPDSVRGAMQSMTPAQRAKEEEQMQQALLADRFKLKAHFETREMPLYELRIAKAGPALKENPDTNKGAAAVGSSRIRGTAVPMYVLCNLLENVPDIGGRVIIDKTGLAGNYDINLKWTPLEFTPNPNAESISLFTAIEEQLGLKLVPTRGPGQVLIIDHIERPTAN
ncbi:MAG: TIGR03435 family protein [Acidobacteriaceae bacterium]